MKETTLKKFLLFQEIKLSRRKFKKLLIFQEELPKPEKTNLLYVYKKSYE